MEYKKVVILIVGVLLFLMLALPFVFAVQPSQQYAQIFLNPFYRASMSSNTNYTYTLGVFTPDKIGQVYSAIIAVDVYLTPTVNYDLWVNGQPCNNPRYTVSTTYSGASQGRLYFDCSNRITGEGFYNITIRADKNSGASVSWLDLTYSNQPKGELTIHGTEYNNNQIAKVWLQLIDADGNYVNDGVCYADIYTPEGEELVEQSVMINMNHDGVYYLDYALTDLPAGVYPAIARCYYQAIQTNNFALTYFLINGTYDSGTIANTYVIDGTSIRFKEKDVKVPAPERDRISVGLNFTNGSICNISEGLLTGINIRTVAKFDSVVNDDITLSIWNYTSSSWVDLPNKVLEGNAFRDVSNSFSTNNITKLGFVNGSGSNLRLRYTDTGLADAGPESNLDIDYATITCDQLTNPEWQEVKGSSEIHITIPEGTEEYIAESLCGESSKNGYLSICSEFRNNLSYANFTWGYIYDKVTFYNSYNADIDEIESYTTSMSQDCTGILNITETRNGTTVSILDNVTLSQGDKDDCIISIPVIFNSSENDYYVEITQENYMKWEVDRKKDLINYYRLPIESFCNNIETQNGITFQIPITGGNDVSTLYASNPILLGCYRTIDDLYWFDYYYNISSAVNTSGEYESYMYNIHMYYEELKDGADAVISITGQNVLVHVNTLCGESSQYPNQYSCAKLMPPDAYFTSQEGYIIQNLTVLNDFNTTSSGFYSYTTAPGIDCSAIMEVIKDNGTRTDIIDEVLFNSGSDGSCNMNIPINNVKGISSYQIELYGENYILWDIYWARDLVNSLNDTIDDFCQDIATNRSITYNLPINASIESYRNDSELYFCYRAMDDLYWWYFFYNKLKSSNFTIVGEIGSYRYESEYFWPKILDDYNIVKTYQRNLNQIQTLADILDIRNNMSQRVWNYTNRTLTDFNFTVNATVTNATNIADSVWAYTNKTVQFANGSVDTVQDIKDMGHTYVGGTEYISGDSGKITIRLVRGTGSLAEIELGATCIVSITYPNGTYFITNASMSELGSGAYYYNFTIPPTLGIYPYFTDCNISDRFYYSLDDFHVYETNFSTIPSTVWNYEAGRNLTYYQVANLTNVTVLVNNTAVAEGVWAYNGTINNNILSQIGEYTWTVFNNIHDFITGIWSASDRTLTSGNCRYLEYGYYNKDLPMLSDISCD